MDTLPVCFLSGTKVKRSVLVTETSQFEVRTRLCVNLRVIREAANIFVTLQEGSEEAWTRVKRSFDEERFGEKRLSTKRAKVVEPTGVFLSTDGFLMVQAKGRKPKAAPKPPDSPLHWVLRYSTISAMQLAVDKENHYAFVVLGAAGDLAKKKTFPSLFQLHMGRLLPGNMHIIGVDNPQFHQDVKNVSDFWEKRLQGYLEKQKGWVAEDLESFKARLQYVQVQLDQPDTVIALDRHLQALAEDRPKQHRVFYLALPPFLFAKAVENLRERCWSQSGWNRVIVEKPFGKNGTQAAELTDSQGKLSFESPPVKTVKKPVGFFPWICIDFKAATLKIRFRFPLNPVKMSLSDEELLASLCKHPRCTAGKDGHPMPDRCRVEDLFDWEAIAKETNVTTEDLIQRTFGCETRGKRPGLLRTFHARKAGAMERLRPQMGVLVLPEFVREEEESNILADFFAKGRGLPWGEREGGGWHASFGPTFIPKSGYKVDRSKVFTELPTVLDSVRSRIEGLLSFKVSDPYQQLVTESLQRYAMSQATRRGQQGPLSQAFVQRYESTGDVDLETCNRKQALGMHFDSRNANAEVVIGLSLGEDQGHIFFSRSGPHKGQAFPLSLAKALEAKGDGLLVQLPRRALYMFYGFARYYLRHGVPWTPCAGAYRRVTVTLRSVPLPPTAPRRRKMEKETEHDAKQRRLMDVLDEFQHTKAARLEINLCSDEEPPGEAKT
eukprot:symbB.v1.2.005954.t1/scaffold351.1/size221948/5